MRALLICSSGPGDAQDVHSKSPSGTCGLSHNERHTLKNRTHSSSTPYIPHLLSDPIPLPGHCSSPAKRVTVREPVIYLKNAQNNISCKFSLHRHHPWFTVLTFSSSALWCSNRLFSAFSTSTSLDTPLWAAACRFTTVMRSDRSCRETRHSRCSSNNCRENEAERWRNWLGQGWF